MDSLADSSLSSISDYEEELDGIIKSTIAAAHHHIYHDSDSLDSSNIWGGSRPGRDPNVPRDSWEQTQYLFLSPRCVIMRVREAINGIDPFIQK